MIQKIKAFFNSGNARSVKAKKNIFQMLLIRGGSILLGMFLLPMTLHYVDKETYGVWLTLSSMVAWISFFDIGLNNGLKNKLAECFAKGDLSLGKTYVSTTYAVLSLVFFSLMIILLLVVPHFDLNKTLNISVDTNELLISISIIITYFCIQFVLNTVNVVLNADQRPASASFRSLLQNVFSIIVIFILTKFTEGNLVKLCAGLCLSPLLVLGLFNFTLFNGKYKTIAPSVKAVDFRCIPDIMKLGVQFFIIQIAGIIQYQLTNFLIIRYYGAAQVTEYNIAYKYFTMLTMVWGILINPLWVAVTDALARKEYSWIVNAQKKYIRTLGGFIIVGLVMLAISPIVYRIWIGNEVNIPFVLSTWVFLYCVATMFSNLFVFILNGAGILKVQTFACVISPFVFLAVTFMLIYMGYGVYSIIIGSTVANFNGLIIAPIQCYNLFKSYQKQ